MCDLLGRVPDDYQQVPGQAVLGAAGEGPCAGACWMEWEPGEMSSDSQASVLGGERWVKQGPPLPIA